MKVLKRQSIGSTKAQSLSSRSTRVPPSPPTRKRGLTMNLRSWSDLAKQLSTPPCLLSVDRSGDNALIFIPEYSSGLSSDYTASFHFFRRDSLARSIAYALHIAKSEMGSTEVESGDQQQDPTAVALVASVSRISSTRCEVTGVVCAQEIQRAYRLHAGGSEAAAGASCIGDTWCSGTVYCGVKLMWVPEHRRRAGLATRMIDYMRTHLCYGFVIPAECVAFSEPTVAGAVFARRYSQREDYLVFLS